MLLYSEAGWLIRTAKPERGDSFKNRQCLAQISAKLITAEHRTAHKRYKSMKPKHKTAFFINSGAGIIL